MMKIMIMMITKTMILMMIMNKMKGHPGPARYNGEQGRSFRRHSFCLTGQPDHRNYVTFGSQKKEDKEEEEETELTV